MTTQPITTRRPTINCKEATIKQLKDAYYNHEPIAGIETIVPHFGPHSDEVFGIYLMQTTVQGKNLFPGIENAGTGCIGTTQLRQYGWMYKEGFFKAMQQGFLLLGLGEGPLDEHSDRDEKISCCELVVRLLDLRHEEMDRKVYGNLARYVNFEDNNGDNLLKQVNKLPLKNKLTKEEAAPFLQLQLGSFAQNLKMGFEVAGTDDKKMLEVFRMAFQFYDNAVAHAQLFIEAENAYMEAQRTKIPLVTPDKNEEFVLLEFQSDAKEIHKVAHMKWRTARKPSLGVLFLHKSNGQFVLMPNNQYFTPEDMREVVKILRQTVAKNAGQPNPIRFNELGENRSIDQVVELYFDEKTGIISNGSKVDPFVPGLLGKLISKNEVIEAVQIALDTKYFPERFAKGCAQGTCAERKCPLYHFGLQRCMDVRSKNRQVAAAFEKAKLQA